MEKEKEIADKIEYCLKRMQEIANEEKQYITGKHEDTMKFMELTSEWLVVYDDCLHYLKVLGGELQN